MPVFSPDKEAAERSIQKISFKLRRNYIVEIHITDHPIVVEFNAAGEDDLEAQVRHFIRTHIKPTENEED